MKKRSYKRPKIKSSKINQVYFYGSRVAKGIDPASPTHLITIAPSFIY